MARLKILTEKTSMVSAPISNLTKMKKRAMTVNIAPMPAKYMDIPRCMILSYEKYFSSSQRRKAIKSTTAA